MVMLDNEVCHRETQTLLAKYEIPIQHIDFDYIDKCNDGRELEKILLILRSGEEGHYPELMKTTETRLAAVKPRSKLLRKACPVQTRDNLTQEEQAEIKNDLHKWIDNVSNSSEELVQFKGRHDGELPTIRATTERREEAPKEKQKHIAATDYSSWDKYDVDTEILKMDLKEERIKESYVKNEKKSKSTALKKTVRIKDFKTEAEAIYEAHQEKEKGNEYFKTGDYQEALQHYTNSINCKPSVASLTNRALTNIKLKKFQNAIEDCNSALTLEPNNIKSLLRKAQALDGIGKHNEALRHVEQAIEIDPNNCLAQDLAEKFRKQCGITATMKNRRMTIQDVSLKNSNKQKENKIIIPIPGTSKMSPPYYITCPANCPETIREETIRAYAKEQMLHIVAVDNSSDLDDDDCCTINHLQRICKSRFSENESKKSDDKLVPMRKCCSIQHHNDEIHMSQSCSYQEESCAIAAKKYYPQSHSDNHQRSEYTLHSPDVRVNRMTDTSRLVIDDDRRAGGEPCIKQPSEYIEIPEDINAPFSFLKTWISANDPTLEQYASILKSIDMDHITEVIGCKLDNDMFTTIVKCLCMHFAVPGELERLHSILSNIVRLPRFEIISLLMSQDDKKSIGILIDFLKQHGKCLPQNVVNKFYN